MSGLYSELIDAYLTDSLTAAQEEEFIRMLDHPDNRALLAKVIDEKAVDGSFTTSEDAVRRERNLARLKERMLEEKINTAGDSAGKVVYIRTWRRWAVAAVVLGVIAAAYFWARPRDIKKTEMAVSKVPKEVRPGGNRAILILSDGTAVALDSAVNGTIAMQGNSSIVKTGDGQIAYNANNHKEKEVMINTMQTPRGGQYQLALPDGTNVWLNAESSITYPASFTGNERNVKITGEVYFEVSKNNHKPFKVEVNNKSSIEVLGTRFNVNAYADEPYIKTTLVDGSIRLTKGASSKLLAPGEQAELGETIEVQKDADIEKALAWKNGIFNFSHSSLAEVMRQLARWYDMDVVYYGPVPNLHFQGKLSKDLNLSQVLRILEAVDVHFSVAGKTIRVSK